MSHVVIVDTGGAEALKNYAHAFFFESEGGPAALFSRLFVYVAFRRPKLVSALASCAPGLYSSSCALTSVFSFHHGIGTRSRK